MSGYVTGMLQMLGAGAAADGVPTRAAVGTEMAVESACDGVADVRVGRAGLVRLCGLRGSANRQRLDSDRPEASVPANGLARVPSAGSMDA